MDTWAVVDAHRREVADLADSLDAQQWDAPSLCTAWRVRDVVAHMTEGATMSTGQALKEVVKSGFRINKMITNGAIRGGAAPTDELAAGIRAAIGSRVRPPGIKPEGILSDEVVHSQDIRRALGLSGQPSPDALRIALAYLAKSRSSLLPAKRRLRGLHVRATDLDWNTGEIGDPEVTGTAEALMMAIAGRAAALDDLSGPGLDTLRTRVSG